MNPLFATICFAFLPQEDAGGHSLPLDWWTDNLRWAIDESVRGIVNGDGDVATLAFFGLDVHKVFSTGNRDIATLTLQPYLTRVDDLVPTPPIFDAKEARAPHALPQNGIIRCWWQNAIVFHHGP